MSSRLVSSGAMRICFFLPYYDPVYPDVGSFLRAARLPLELPAALVRRGHSVDVVMLSPSDERFQINGVRYHAFTSGRVVRVLARAGARIYGTQAPLLEPARRALRHVAALQPDVVHVHGTNLYVNLALLRIAFRGREIPVVIHYHGGSPAKNRLLRALQGFGLGAASRWLFTAPEQSTAFIDAGLVDPVGVNQLTETSSAFERRPRSEARRQTGMRGDPVVLSASRLHPIKDPFTSLRAFELILHQRSEAEFYLFYTSGELLSEVRRFLAERPHLHAHVHLEGRCPYDQMEAVYNSADFLLQASLREFSGCAILDAMACGVVPVITDIPAFRAMAGAAACLVPIRLPEAMADAVASIHPDEIDERSHFVRDYFERHLSFAAMATSLEAIYSTIAAARLART